MAVAAPPGCMQKWQAVNRPAIMRIDCLLSGTARRPQRRSPRDGPHRSARLRTSLLQIGRCPHPMDALPHCLIPARSANRHRPASWRYFRSMAPSGLDERTIHGSLLVRRQT